MDKLNAGEECLDLGKSVGTDMVKLIRKIPLRFKVVGLIAMALVVAFVAGAALPLLLDRDKTQYVSESDLKEAVDIGELTSMSCTYNGIAEKHSNWLWSDHVDYRVKYEAYVRASYQMSDIEFAVDDTNMVVTAYLPEVSIGEPVINESKFGYLPADADADISEILAICKEDATSEVNREELDEESLFNLQKAVTSLTMPLLGDDWTIEFKSLSEYGGRGVASNATE